MAPLLALGPDGEMVAEMPYAELQCMLDDPPGYRNYWSAEYLDTFPDEAVDRVQRARRDMIVPSPSQHVLFPRAARSPAGPPATRSRGARRPGSSTRSGCGTTRPTTSAGSGGRADSAPTCGPGRPATCTSTSSATRATIGWSPGFGRENYERLAADQGASTTRTTSSTSTTTSRRAAPATEGEQLRRTAVKGAGHGHSDA